MVTLDPREQRFVEEYIIDLDPKRAAIAAGYSRTMAASKVYQWVSNSKVKPHVYAAIESGRQKLAKKAEMSAEEVRQAFSKIGRHDVRKLFTETGALKPIHELDDDTAAAISSIEVINKLTRTKGKRPSKTQLTKVKTYDKVGALTQLARIHGMMQDKVQVEHTMTLEALIMGVIAREEAEKAPQPPTIEGTVTEEKPE